MNEPVTNLSEQDIGAASRLLSDTCPWHPVSEQRLRRKLFDLRSFDPDLALAVRGNDGRLDAIAAATGCSRGATSTSAELLALATRPDRRRQGLAGSLYTEIERNLRRKGVSEIQVYGSLLSSGLDLRYASAVTMLMRRLYSPTKVSYDMVLDAEASVPSMDAPEGFTVRDLTISDQSTLRDLCAAEFPDWTYALGLIRAGEPCGVIGIFDCRNRLAAFAGWNEYIFGPTGTAAAYRRHGLGRTVFWQVVQAMRAAGFGKHICISAANVPYYARAFGCHVSGVTWQLSKTLQPRDCSSGDCRIGALGPCSV